MTFYTYMMRHHKGEDTPAGDLAADMKRDSDKFPRNTPHKLDVWFGIIYDHLMFVGACHDCLRTFAECWGEYMAFLEKKRRTKTNTSAISDNSEHCICCGEIIPEGRQVCPYCERQDRYV